VFICPKYIKDAVKRYDDRLDVVWNSACNWWNIVYRSVTGKRENVCVCVHDDGSVVRGNDLSLDELMRNIRQMDKANVDVVAEFDANEKLRHDALVNERKHTDIENVYKTEDISKFFKRGLRPFVSFR